MEDSSSALAGQTGNCVISEGIAAGAHSDNNDHQDQCMKMASEDEEKKHLPIPLSLIPKKRSINSEEDRQKRIKTENTGDFQPSSSLPLSMTLDESPRDKLRKAIIAAGEGISLNAAEADDLNVVARSFGLRDCRGPDDKWLIDGLLRPLFHHQLLALFFMLKRELSTEDPYGGLNADVMGLGKTVEALATVVMNPPDEHDLREGRKVTLWVCPKSSITQIKETAQEFCCETKLPNVLVYDRAALTNTHGDDLERYLQEQDIIIINYESLIRDFPSEYHPKNTPLQPWASGVRAGPHWNPLGPLMKIKYYRVILDEAHRIKNTESRTMYACSYLDAKYRWCLTGTPLLNSVAEIYPYLMFLQVPEVNKKHYSFAILCTKDELIVLPIAHREVILVTQTKEQRVIYKWFAQRTRESFNKQLANHPLNRKQSNYKTVYKTVYRRGYRGRYRKQYKVLLKGKDPEGREDKWEWFSIVDILRLRQMACDPSLIEYMLRGGREFEFTNNMLSKIADGEDPILMQYELKGGRELRFVDQMLSELADHKGKNRFYDMVFQWREDQKLALLSSLRGSTSTVLVAGQSANTDGTDNPTSRQGGPEYLRKPKIPFKSEYLTNVDMNPDQDMLLGSKMHAIKASIQKHLADGPDDKLLIFNEFLYCANLIGYMLDGMKIKHIYYFGSESSDSRDKAIEAFENDPELRVMLLSMKCGGLALNLAVANRVITVEPWWNKGIEEQALARVHRLGQAKEVYHTRIIAKRTIEPNMVALQDAKELAISEALESKFSGEMSSLEQTARLMGRVVYGANGKIVAVNADDDSDTEPDSDDEDSKAESGSRGA
ncbi:P-loop containing nucleoside triphosphate hydrolase protein [Xylaria venustula]|nr:P-loop containing nucleoside triphosphate hydrolase protein [Xylaria venustula]